MIFYAPPGEAVPLPIIKVAEVAAISAFQVTNAPPSTGGPSQIEGFSGLQAEIQPEKHEVFETFDWENNKTRREYIKIEQRVLAGLADSEEQKRYRLMKRDRNSQIFAERYFHDYAELQRLQKLSEKLEEVQQYLRPIVFQ